MNECLVTRLKSSVDADLEFFGQLEYEFKEPFNAKFASGVFPGSEFIASGDIEIYNYQETVNYGKTYEVPNFANVYDAVTVKCNGKGTLRITNKYNNVYDKTYSASLYNTKYGFDIKSIEYWFKGVIFNAVSLKDYNNGGDGSPLEGNLEDLSTSKAYEFIHIARSNVKGNIGIIASRYKDSIQKVEIYQNKDVGGSINDFGLCNNLQKLSVANCSLIEGSVEGFVSKARSVGKLSGEITLSAVGTQITFKGESISASGTLSWTSSTITLNGVTITT